jgi:hypothetical protein
MTRMACLIDVLNFGRSLERETRQAKRLQEIGIQVLRRQSRQVEAARHGAARTVQGIHRHCRFLHGALQQHPAGILPCDDRIAVDASQGIAALESRGSRGGVRRRLIDHRLDAGHAIQEQHPVQRDCEEEIGYGARHDDGKSPPHRLPVEGARQL